VSTVEIDRSRGEIAVVSLNRPERMNALNVELVTDLRHAIQELSRDRTSRVVVLRGNGRGFCAGADLKGDTTRVAGTEQMGELGYIYKMQENLAETMIALHECDKPIVAAVHGAAVGGGLAIALASDVRLAAPATRFGAVFIRVGLSACDVGVSYFLPRIVGAGRAAELMLTGRHFDAAEADRIGMLHAVVPEEKLLDAALDKAREIAANSEYGVWMTKRGLWTNLDAPSLRHAIELENRQQVLGTFTGNMIEAMHAFQEKRAPRWKPL
jgi:enoyl-CoA hydratase